MITALDHIALAVRDFEAAVDSYRRLFGREPELEPGDGANRAWFHFPNMALEIIAPSGEGPAGDRVRARLDASGEGQWIVAFQVSDLDAAAQLLTRRGLDVARAHRARVRAAGLQRTGGVQVALMNFTAARPPRRPPVTALDHVVVRTANADRALANFGAKFGLDLRLDRANEQWGVRQLFFRCRAMRCSKSARA